MKRNIRMDLINKIKNDDLIGAKETFKAAMSAKVLDRIDQLRQSVGSNMYNKDDSGKEEG
jgi:hypothetical protein